MKTNWNIRMAGIDYHTAALACRELFSFTKAGAQEAMKAMRREYNLCGCVLISTCNRTELWITTNGHSEEIAPEEMLCWVKGISPVQEESFFVKREGEEAVHHLLELACGLDSRIFGEDQIIAQVREALYLARKQQCTDMVLEKVFQTAIRAAKEVRSCLSLAEADGSTAGKVLSLLKAATVELKDLPCLVIGNGQMGQLTAAVLVQHGAKVKMTLRRAMHGQRPVDSIIPEGCEMIPYEERMSALASSAVVISATRSPHYTLKKEDVLPCFAECGTEHEAHVTDQTVSEKQCTQAETLPAPRKVKEKSRIWIDLAVPRDIDPGIAELEQILLVDIDQLSQGGSQEKNAKNREAAERMLREYLAELNQWFVFRDRVPEIQDILRLSVEDVAKRLDHSLQAADLPAEGKEKMQAEIERAVEKSLGKLLFGLKETLHHSLWKECLDAVHSAARKDTHKS